MSSYKEQSLKAKEIRLGITDARPVSSSKSKLPKIWIVRYKYRFLRWLQVREHWDTKKFPKESSARMSAESMVKQEIYTDVVLVYPCGKEEVMKASVVSEPQVDSEKNQ